MVVVVFCGVGDADACADAEEGAADADCCAIEAWPLLVGLWEAGVVCK